MDDRQASYGNNRRGGNGYGHGSPRGDYRHNGRGQYDRDDRGGERRNEYRSYDRRPNHDGTNRSGSFQQHGRQQWRGGNINNDHRNKRFKTEEPQIIKENVDDLTSEQQAYRERFKQLLQFEGAIEGIPLQAFCPKYSEEEKEDAAQYALEKAEEHMKAVGRNSNEGYSSDSADSLDDDYPGRSRRNDPCALTLGQKRFFLKLKDCLPLAAGFDVEGSSSTNFCYCPCSRQMKKWREQDRDVDMLIDERDQKDRKRDPCRHFEPMGLMAHLEKEGETCILHFGTRIYLEKLYENHNGPGIGHKNLYKLGDDKYKKADAEQTRNLQRFIRRGQQELAKEKEKNRQMELEFKNLEKISKDLCEQNKMLEEWRKVMHVEKKEKKKISEAQLSSNRVVMATYFSFLRTTYFRKSKGEIHMTVQSNPPQSKTSFSLQTFFDDYYDENPSLVILAEKPKDKKDKKSAASRKSAAKKQVKHTRHVLFGEYDGDGDIEHAMLSTWKITFKESADQDVDDTAVDEGGPLKQFKGDCWKQLNDLSIVIGEKKIKLFEDGDGGIIPITDEMLEYHIKKKAGSSEKKVVESAIKRAKAYARAVGRIVFNSFQDFEHHSVPRSVMLAIFANLILRGCIPGDDDYERDDVLKHIVPLAPSVVTKKKEDNAIMWHIGRHVDEDDDTSELWTPDLIFKKLIPDEFIRSRSVLLGGLADGLSLERTQNSGTPLEKGSSLAAAFRSFSLEALQSILFGKSKMTVEEVLAVLEPDYCQSEGKWEGTDEQIEEEKEKQKEFFEGDFKRYIREEAGKSPDFLEDFVEFCTGSTYIPFSSPGEKAFKIIVEFNFTSPEPGQLPMSHTCVNTIRFPGMGIYFGDYNLFGEKMELALAQCSRFDMK
mmetsp:Transcript_38179/g.80336  ORF Transcript_38179/g.80336 Transcript_38179/m.80336 type:complete len:882 (-) Transcript_38179:220-2865(-)